MSTMWIGRTGAGQDFVQFEQGLSLRPGPTVEISGKFRKIAPVFSRGGFVEQPAQAEKVRPFTAGTFGWNESFRTHERARLVRTRHQTDIRKLRLAADVD